MRHFSYAGYGKIVLVDTIGTGTTSLDVKEEMLRTVCEDSDAIIPCKVSVLTKICQHAKLNTVFEEMTDLLTKVKPKIK